MGSSPKAPKKTTEELAAERRQAEELTKLDEDENERIKRMKRGRYSSRLRSAGASLGGASASASGNAGTPASSGTPTVRTGGGGGGVNSRSRRAIA